MLSIKYQPFSLLYGQSIFWLVYSVFAPLHLLPDLSNCKCQYVVERIPRSQMVVSLVNLARNNSIIRTLFNTTFIGFQVTYLFIYLIGNFLLTANRLASFGSQYSESLTYKVLYNTPTLSNLGLLIITLRNMLDYEGRLWNILDDFDTLSIDYNYQARFAKFCMLLTVPDIIIHMLESFLIVNYIIASANYDRFIGKYFSSLYYQAAFTYSMYVLALMSGLVNMMIRYKPLSSLLYSSTCVSKHLALINSQLTIQHHGIAGKMQLTHSNTDAMSGTTTAATAVNTTKIIANTNYNNKMDLDPNLEMFKQRYNDRLKRFEIYNSPRTSLPVIENSTGARLSLVGGQQAIKLQDSSKKTTTTSSNSQSQNNEKPYFSISNLYELERHLTKVSNLMYDMDRIAPESMLALTAINFMQYFFLAYYLLFDRTWTLSVAYICICFARTLPISVMLISGTRLEKECKRLVIKLESIYLQNQSQSLIYKQMASSHLSLARIFKILERIRINCDGLMKINSGTLRKCFIYLATIMVIVVQYDALMYINVK